MTARRPNAAFTLVELIVVLGAVALMLGLLMPALGAARAGARSARCQSNQRQMVLAALHYATVYDTWPAAVRYENDDTFTTVAWDWVQTAGGDILGPGPLWAFTDSPDDVQQCPDFHGATSFGSDPFTGYNYNASYLAPEARFPQVGWALVRRGTPPHACARSSTCAAFGDGGRAGGTNKFMRAPDNPEGDSWALTYSGGQAFRHLQSTNVAYVDGHVGQVGTAEPGEHATPELLTAYLGYAENGFLSSNGDAYRAR